MVSFYTQTCCDGGVVYQDPVCDNAVVLYNRTVCDSAAVYQDPIWDSAVVYSDLLCDGACVYYAYDSAVVYQKHMR